MNSVWSPRKGLGLGAGGWAAGLFPLDSQHAYEQVGVLVCGPSFRNLPAGCCQD